MSTPSKRSNPALPGAGLWSSARDGAAPVLAVQALATGAPELSPFSETAERLIALFRSGLWNPSEANLVVGYDRDLADRLVQAANALFDGQGSSIGSAHTAVARLGSSRLLALTVAHSMRGPLENAGRAAGIPEGVLWRHAAASALTAIKLEEYLDEPPPKEAPTAALLHDVGHLVFDAALPADSAAVLAADPRTGWCGSRTAENELLGTTHAEVGGALVGHWGFPTSIVDGVGFHHAPGQAVASASRRVAFVVNASDMIAATIGAGLGAREQDPVDEALALNELGLSPEDYSRVAREVFDALEGFLGALG